MAPRALPKTRASSGLSKGAPSCRASCGARQRTSAQRLPFSLRLPSRRGSLGTVTQKMTGTIRYAPTSGVIITGAGSGIGRATTLALAEAGRPVAAWDLNGETAEAVADAVRARFGVA